MAGSGSDSRKAARDSSAVFTCRRVERIESTPTQIAIGTGTPSELRHGGGGRGRGAEREQGEEGGRGGRRRRRSAFWRCPRPLDCMFRSSRRARVSGLRRQPVQRGRWTIAKGKGGTQEMTQPCLIDLHVSSLWSGGGAAIGPDGELGRDGEEHEGVGHDPGQTGQHGLGLGDGHSGHLLTPPARGSQVCAAVDNGGGGGPPGSRTESSGCVCCVFVWWWWCVRVSLCVCHCACVRVFAGNKTSAVSRFSRSCSSPTWRPTKEMRHAGSRSAQGLHHLCSADSIRQGLHHLGARWPGGRRSSSGPSARAVTITLERARSTQHAWHTPARGRWPSRWTGA